MKKLLTFTSAACLALMVSCGPSAEEKARMEQARQDSINQVMEIARQDSIMRAEEQARLDSTNRAMAMQDSINKAVADSLANAAKAPKPKPKPKTTPKPTKPEEVKPGQGRG